MLFRRKEHVCALEATRSFWRLFVLDDLFATLFSGGRCNEFVLSSHGVV
jgi:hypothetical protein